MHNKKIIKEGYISELDRFLKKFDQSHSRFCAARVAEIEKNQKIAEKRDKVYNTENQENAINAA